MKVLVFCPTAPRLEPEVVNAIFNQTGVEFFDVLFTVDNPYKDKLLNKNIQFNYEKMRQIVLDKYDKVWCIESDTIPEYDALSKLLDVDAPVVSGLYPLRHGTPTPNIRQWDENLHGIGSCLTWEEVKSKEGQTIQTSGTCTGCVVIDKEVLRGFSFMIKENKAPDTPFNEYCFHNNIKQMARLDVMCLHKQPDGTILDPRDYLRN